MRRDSSIIVRRGDREGVGSDGYGDGPKTARAGLDGSGSGATGSGLLISIE